MTKLNSKTYQYILASAIIVFGLLLSAPAQAEETTTTPEFATTTPETTAATTTSDIATSTIDTATTTLEITIPTSTPETATTTIETTTTTEEISTSTIDTATTTVVNQTIPTDEINSAIQKILNYFKSQQSADGKIVDGNTTDWVIMSYGADGQYGDEIKNATSSLLDYEKNYNLDDPSDLNSCASYPRHILALLAAGVSKNDTAIQGLKNKMLTVCYQNNLYGLHGINDDVFGLIALLALDIAPAEAIIQDIVSTTKSWQIESGAFSWPDWNPNSTAKIAGDDITGAAVNALKYAQSKGVEINNEIFAKAKTYLKSTQQTDGGWGYGASDIMTTSWVLMGVNALDEGQNEWFNSAGKNPWHPLISQLKDSGYYESAWVPSTTDWFATKHAVPALAGKSWPIILPEKITHFEIGPNVTYSNSGCGSCYNILPIIAPTTTPATTTLAETATTTIATTTTATTTAAATATTTSENILNNFSVQATTVTATTSTPKLTVKKTTKPAAKPILSKPEIKGEKITAPIEEPLPINRASDQPKNKKNLIIKGLNWIWGLLKNLI